LALLLLLLFQDAHIEKIRMLFSEIDEDESGVITYQMYEKGIRSQDVKMLGRCDSASVNPVVQHLSTS
jgi:hypothetical protein